MEGFKILIDFLGLGYHTFFGVKINHWHSKPPSNTLSFIINFIKYRNYFILIVKIMTSLSAQLADALDIIEGDDSRGLKHGEISASQKLLNEKRRVTSQFGNFVPLVSSSSSSSSGKISYLNQIATSNVPNAKYWNNNNKSKKKNAFKASQPSTKKQIAKKKKGEDYSDRLKVKAMKSMNKSTKRRASKM